MRHKFLVLTVKKWIKSVYIYGSYRKIKTGVSLFWTTQYMQIITDHRQAECFARLHVRFDTAVSVLRATMQVRYLLRHFCSSIFPSVCYTRDSIKKFAYNYHELPSKTSEILYTATLSFLALYLWFMVCSNVDNGDGLSLLDTLAHKCISGRASDYLDSIAQTPLYFDLLWICCTANPQQARRRTCVVHKSDGVVCCMQYDRLSEQQLGFLLPRWPSYLKPFATT